MQAFSCLGILTTVQTQAYWQDLYASVTFTYDAAQFRSVSRLLIEMITTLFLAW